MSRHVVFGAGQVGAPLASELMARCHDVIVVSRSGRTSVAGARNVTGNAPDPLFTTEVCTGADVVHFCLDAPDYGRWPEQFPPLQRGVLAGAREARARLVVLENLYAYGDVGGRPLVEDLPLVATSAKARTRAAMTRELLEAHAAGDVEVAIGRASDYFGPDVTHSALGELVFANAVAGKTAQVMGDPDRRHSYSHVPDVAAALATLGESPAAVGQVWHLPVADAWTTRQALDHVHVLVGHTSKTFAAGRTTLRLLGVFQPAMKEYLHTLHQFTEDWVVDDTRFREAFGDHCTPLPEALAATVEWYRHVGSRSVTSPP
jgi:nucleoside-diphosphate-sugar epimerase